MSNSIKGSAHFIGGTAAGKAAGTRVNWQAFQNSKNPIHPADAKLGQLTFREIVTGILKASP